MTAHITLRLQFDPHRDVHETAARWVRLCRDADVDEVMLFFFAEEFNNGHDTVDEIREWLALSRPITEALHAVGVRTSLNPWHSVLHVDRGRTLKPDQAQWQRMMDPNGRAATAVVCPLDPGWRTYYRQTLALYADAPFDVIWVDDDIRYHNHGDLAWGGCFCPLHMQAFSEHIGEPVTREALVAACTAPGKPHPWREQWMDLWDQQHLALLTEWRRLVESKGKRLGLMSSLPEQHAAEGRRWKEWWRAISSDKVVYHRPHFWPYEEVMGRELPLAINRLDQNRSIQPDGVSSEPEIECIPYTPWNKSLRQTGAQMALAQMFGAAKLQCSVYDHMGNDPDDDPSRAAFLRAWKPALNWIADEFPAALRTQGIGLPWSEDMGRRLHTARGGSWEELVCPSRGWAGWLGAAGLATSVQTDGNVIALGGPVVHALSDEQIGRWLRRGLLLDGYAARVLAERGFAAEIGLAHIHAITQNDRPYAVEVCVHPDYTFRPGALISVNSEFFTPYGQHLIQGTPAPEATLVTELRGPQQERMGHGVIAFTNRHGGRVAIAPWNADTPPHMNHLRADQWARITTFLNRGSPCFRAEGGAWLVPVVFADAHQWRAVIWNGSSDDVATITWHGLSERMRMTEAFVLAANGVRRALQNPTVDLRLAEPLRAWECVILKGEYST